jgi:hypothetical protein
MGARDDIQKKRAQFARAATRIPSSFAPARPHIREVVDVGTVEHASCELRQEPAHSCRQPEHHVRKGASPVRLQLTIDIGIVRKGVNA